MSLKLLSLYMDVCLIVLLEAQSLVFWVLGDVPAMPATEHKGLNLFPRSHIITLSAGHSYNPGLAGYLAYPKDDTLHLSSGLYTWTPAYMYTHA